MRKGKSADWDEYIAETTTVGDTGWVRGFEEMTSKLPKRMTSMLEVGCSHGRWIQWLRQRHQVKDAHGLDIFDITKIHVKGRYSKKEKRSFTFTKGDARRLPYKDKRFDLAYSLGLIEHFKDKRDVERILREQARVLRKGGYIITTFPTLNYDSLMYWRIKLLEDPHHSYKHYHTTIPQVKRIYKKLGIEVLEAKHLGWFFEPFGVPRIIPTRQFSQIACIIGRKAK